MALKFKNKDGQQSAYALACGYVQKTQLAGYRVELYQEHGAYHVKARPHGGTWLDRGGAWDTYDSLTEARKAYKKLVKELSIR